MRHCVVLVFVVSLSISECFHIDELIMNPGSVSGDMNKDIADQQRIKRQASRFGQGRTYLPVGQQSRAPTVIVVPERGDYGNPGSGTVPGYGTGISPYTANTPNRGTTVVVSQVPEYYNNVGRSYDVMPINPIRV